jgi:hypothetical protein
MGRMAAVTVTLAALIGLLALPAVSGARPLSFRAWSAQWSARTAKDNARVVDRCQKLFGASDLKFGMCFVEAGRANLQAERRLWERQVAALSRGQAPACRRAIRSYLLAARIRQRASLTYLASHPRTPITRIAGDIAGEPYAMLKTLADQARARAVAVCG